ncbi:MAG: TIGR02757 family protein [Cyclobacteriaceae bacterium]
MPNKLKRSELKQLLDDKVETYNNKDFVINDPVSIPHLFNKQQDIEIAGFWAAVLSWGQRVTIINKSKELFNLMDNSPHDFILNHQEHDLKRFDSFKHRTFNLTDTLYFIEFFKYYYQNHSSLEDAFLQGLTEQSDMEKGLINFHYIFFSLPEFPARTRKHIATPERNSACKRLNMFLRWMVRHDNQGVDFGLWKRIKPSQLICPCDLHVIRVAGKLGLIRQKQNGWSTAKELTANLLRFDANDPVKYDYALFGMGIVEGFGY